MSGIGALTLALICLCLWPLWCCWRGLRAMCRAEVSDGQAGLID